MRRRLKWLTGERAKAWFAYASKVILDIVMAEMIGELLRLW